jgi:uncharacterized protein YacL
MTKHLSKNNCLVACGLASAFFGGMLYISLNPYKYDVLQNMLSKLDSEQLAVYRTIHKERMQIYLIGLLLGLLLGFIYLNINQSTSVARTCTFVSIVMGVNYLFYMIYPKSTYLVRHLKTQEQLDAWQVVYRTMQYRQYMGMVLGLVAYVLVSLV